MCPFIQIDKTVVGMIKLVALVICFGLRMIAIALR